MENSHIAWTDNTFNPWSGCQKVSDGCKFCYAERIVGPTMWGPNAQRRVHGGDYWLQPDYWQDLALRLQRRLRVFCGSICDVFEDRPELARPRADLWEIVERTTALDWPTIGMAVS